MAVVEFEIKDLEKMIGRRLTKESIERIQMLGFPLERVDESKVAYEVFPNRPDALSIEGFARAAKTFLGFSKGIVNYTVKKGAIKLRVDKSVEKVRPCVVSAVVRNVKLTDDLLRSLMQVQEKLHDTLGRKRKKVAIGIHDLDRVTPPFEYKAVNPDSLKFIPLDFQETMTMREIGTKHPKGRDYIHILEGSNVWPIIVDAKNQVLSFPPIINGELTRVTGRTKNIFIDITGTDDIAVNQALNIIVTAFADRNCAIENVELTGYIKKTTPDISPRKIKVNLDYANKLLDMELSQKEFTEIAAKMGYGFEKGNIIIPCYRTDIMHPIDIVEDIAIAHGYENFDPKIPRVPTTAKRNEKAEAKNILRGLLVGAGFQEIICTLLTNEADEFMKMNKQKEEVCETKNPLTVECSICRKSLLPSIMRVLLQNRTNEYPQKIFEVGDVLIVDNKQETGAKNVLKVCAAISDTKVGYENLSTVLDAFLRNLGITYELKKASDASFIAGRCAEVWSGERRLGIIGEVHPQVLENWSLGNPVVAFELNADKIIEMKTKGKK